jgi:hypothetical protein
VLWPRQAVDVGALLTGIPLYPGAGPGLTLSRYASGSTWATRPFRHGGTAITLMP